MYCVPVHRQDCELLSYSYAYMGEAQDMHELAALRFTLYTFKSHTESIGVLSQQEQHRGDPAAEEDAS